MVKVKLSPHARERIAQLSQQASTIIRDMSRSMGFLTIELSPQMMLMLVELSKTGMYPPTPEGVAEELLRENLRQTILHGWEQWAARPRRSDARQGARSRSRRSPKK